MDDTTDLSFVDAHVGTHNEVMTMQVGYDEHSFGYRDLEGTKVIYKSHCASSMVNQECWRLEPANFRQRREAMKLSILFFLSGKRSIALFSAGTQSFEGRLWGAFSRGGEAVAFSLHA